MKKSLIVLGVAAVAIMAGCEAQKINFEGKKRSMADVGEMLEDRLEKENPGMDIDVSVVDDTDSDSSKKKKKSGKRR